MFDVQQYGEICLWVVPMVIIVSTFVRTLFSNLGHIKTWGDHLWVLLQYVFCVGVVVHEASHQLFCKIFGVRVEKVKYFGITYKEVDGDKKDKGKSSRTAEFMRSNGRKPVSAGGYVRPSEKIDSVSVSFFVGVAPLIINGLLVALIVYYAPILMETAYWELCVYLGIALGLGSRPSGADILFFLRTFKRNPGRGFLELLVFLCFGGVLYLFIAVWQVEVWIVLAAMLLFFTILVLQFRMKKGKSRSRYFSGM